QLAASYLEPLEAEHAEAHRDIDALGGQGADLRQEVVRARLGHPHDRTSGNVHDYPRWLVDAGRTAPPVVAVVVTRDPGPGFDDVLGGVAAQDYPNLRLLVLDISGERDLESRVISHLPDAYFRQAAAQRTFGGAANESLRLVEGSGFFLFLHEDVVLDP